MNPAQSFSSFIPLLTSWNEAIISRFQSRDSVLLTLDDGPHEVATFEALDALTLTDLKATFFLVAEQIEKFPDIADQILSHGYEIGNHSYSHRRMDVLREEEIVHEVSRSNQIIEHFLGYPPKYFRPPYGRFNRALLRLLHERNQKLLLWNRMPSDFSSAVSVDDMRKYFSEKLRGGDIVVLHDNEKTVHKIGETIRALAEILEEKKLTSRFLPAAKKESSNV